PPRLSVRFASSPCRTFAMKSRPPPAPSSARDGGIARLPARYREPLVLYDLEGLTTGAVAQRLRCPQGTILSRLSRGRERLRANLIRRGLAPVDGLATRALRPEPEATGVPGVLLSSTVHLATRFLEQPAAAARASASLASLA